MRTTLLVLSLVLAAGSALAQPQELVNAEWAIPANNAHWEVVSIYRPAILRAEVMGLKNAAKGLRVRVVNAEDVTSCRVRGGTCRDLPNWRHPGEVSFSQTDRIPPGQWAFLVENSYNIFKGAIVRVHLVLDPY